jgi:hypothetical protein
VNEPARAEDAGWLAKTLGGVAGVGLLTMSLRTRLVKEPQLLDTPLVQFLLRYGQPAMTTKTIAGTPNALPYPRRSAGTKGKPKRTALKDVAYLPRGFDRPVLVYLKVAALVLLGGVVDQIHDDPDAEHEEPQQRPKEAEPLWPH